MFQELNHFVKDEDIRQLMLRHGYKEKPQADGRIALNSYVFDAARALLEYVERESLLYGGLPFSTRSGLILPEGVTVVPDEFEGLSPEAKREQAMRKYPAFFLMESKTQGMGHSSSDYWTNEYLQILKEVYHERLGWMRDFSCGTAYALTATSSVVTYQAYEPTDYLSRYNARLIEHLEKRGLWDSQMNCAEHTASGPMGTPGEVHFPNAVMFVVREDEDNQLVFVGAYRGAHASYKTKVAGATDESGYRWSSEIIYRIALPYDKLSIEEVGALVERERTHRTNFGWVCYAMTDADGKLRLIDSMDWDRLRFQCTVVATKEETPNAP